MRILFFALEAVILCCCAPLPSSIPEPSGTSGKAVIFDIDGTLTPYPQAISTARKDAAKAVQVYSDKGYKIIYLSARVLLLQFNIPDWLNKEGFPAGSINVPQTVADYKDPLQFKVRILASYIAKGWTLEFAYGDSTTDFDAYSIVGIPQDRVFALRREGYAACQSGAWKACLSGWTEHMGLISK